MFINANDIASQLSAVFDELNINSICFHTDLTSIGPLYQAKTRFEQVDGYAKLIQSALSGRILLLPTFNYAYTKTRIYNVQKDPCEVGVLNEYFRKHINNNNINNIKIESIRTRTPVFNFYILNDKKKIFNTEVLADPFSNRSTFAQMTEYKTWLGFFGAPLKSLTFNHYIEHVLDIGYRYYKKFPGQVIDNNINSDFGNNFETFVNFGYKVRVIHSDFIDENDWEKIDQDMNAAGILHKYSIGNGELLLIRCDHLFSHLYNLLHKDELYVFTDRARHSIAKLIKQFGYPFTLEMFENT